MGRTIGVVKGKTVDTYGGAYKPAKGVKPAADPAKEKTLSQMNLDELKAKAAELELTIADDATKKQITEAIKEAQAASDNADGGE